MMYLLLIGLELFLQCSETALQFEFLSHHISICEPILANPRFAPLQICDSLSPLFQEAAYFMGEISSLLCLSLEFIEVRFSSRFWETCRLGQMGVVRLNVVPTVIRIFLWTSISLGSAPRNRST